MRSKRIQGINRKSNRKTYKKRSYRKSKKSKRSSRKTRRSFLKKTRRGNNKKMRGGALVALHEHFFTLQEPSEVVIQHNKTCCYEELKNLCLNYNSPNEVEYRKKYIENLASIFKEGTTKDTILSDYNLDKYDITLNIDYFNKVIKRPEEPDEPVATGAPKGQAVLEVTPVNPPSLEEHESNIRGALKSLYETPLTPKGIDVVKEEAEAAETAKAVGEGNEKLDHRW